MELVLWVSSSCAKLLFPPHSLRWALDLSIRVWLVRVAWALLSAKRLLQKGKFSIWPQHTGLLGGQTAAWETPPGKGGLQRIHLENSSQVLMPAPPSQACSCLQSSPSPCGGCRLLCAQFPGQEPQAGRPSCWWEGMSIYWARNFHSLPHFILTSLWVVILTSPCTSGETLSKLLSYSCLSDLIYEH